MRGGEIAPNISGFYFLPTDCLVRGTLVANGTTWRTGVAGVVSSDSSNNRCQECQCLEGRAECRDSENCGSPPQSERTPRQDSVTPLPLRASGRPRRLPSPHAAAAAAAAAACSRGRSAAPRASGERWTERCQRCECLVSTRIKFSNRAKHLPQDAGKGNGNFLKIIFPILQHS